MMLSTYLLEISEKNHQISPISNDMFSQMITNVYEACQYTYSIYHVLAMFILNIILLNYSHIQKYLGKCLRFGSNGIKISCFFGIPKKNSYLSIFFLLFSKKELINTKKQSKITKQKTSTNKIITVSSIIIGLIIFINIAYFEKHYKRKQQLSQLKEVAKFLKIPKITRLFLYCHSG